jgi:transcription initiation factor TFIIIB Brf1 subunit/transcription initiation factor TFIIB
MDGPIMSAAPTLGCPKCGTTIEIQDHKVGAYVLRPCGCEFQRITANEIKDGRVINVAFDGRWCRRVEQ